MTAIAIVGSGADRLARFLEPVLPAGNVTLVLADGEESGLEVALSILLADSPPRGTRRTDVVLVENGPGFAHVPQRDIERNMKEATGAAKVLIYGDENGRERAFRKVMDMAISRAGGRMPDDIPSELIKRIKAETPEGRMSCPRARELAGELELPVSLVGRALDLLDVKIVECGLGCF